MYRTLRTGASNTPSALPRGDTLIFYVNGQKVVDQRPDPELYLAYYLRYKLNLRGTKLGCNEAQCGSCTVMLSKYDLVTGKIKHSSVNACIVPIAAVHGCSVTTIEGIGSLARGLHPVQERLSKGHGSQCGFCTPGMIMSMYTLLRNNPKPTKQDIELQLQGNLCRCTGYRPILESFYGFTKEKCPCGSYACCNGESEGNEKCCREKDDPVISDWMHCRPYDPSQEPIFPSELNKERSFLSNSLTFVGPRVTLFRPTSIQELMMILEKYPHSQISGTHGWTSMTNRLSADPTYKYVITTMDISEMKCIDHRPEGLYVGSALTIDELHKAVQESTNTRMMNEHQSKYMRGIANILPFLGNQHVRNFMSWAGNVASGWSVSDISICLLASSATLHVIGPNGQERSIKLDRNNAYFLGNGKVALEKGEWVVGMTIPYSHEHDKFYVFKQGQRHGPDGPTVNSSMRVTMNPRSHMVKEIALAFGGITDKPVLAEFTAKELEGKEWNESLLEHGTNTLNREIDQLINNKGIRIPYRILLCMSFFRKFYELVKSELEGNLEASDIQALIDYPHPDPMKATQIWHDLTHDQPPIDPIGRPIMHQSGEKHTTGEAVYGDDIPTILGECHAALVYSERAHAKILSIDPSEALKMPGVLTYIDGKDIPPNGSMRPAVPFGDEPMFAEGEVVAFGQIIGAIIAEDQLIACRAVNLVKVQYHDLPAILSIDDAISANSMFPQELHLKRGQPPASVFPECHTVMRGEVSTGWQEHFYMETNNCLVIPKDGDEYEVYSSSQAISFAQNEVAAALGIPNHKVIAKVKRIGGGFGGKQTNYSKPLHSAALAAKKLKRPVRCVLNRHHDFAVTGKRHAMKWKFEVGYNDDGKVIALHLIAYANGGWSVDLSELYLVHLLHNVDHCYAIPHLQADGYVCKTNLPSSTSFRGFGKSEAHFVLEEIMERVARSLNIQPDKVKEMNFYKLGDILLNHEILRDYGLPRCWNECKLRSEYEKRRIEVDEFNSHHKWTKRGLAIVPVVWAQGDNHSIIEQGGVLVTVYRDGSVQISHGGTEMGQGLNTKVMMAAANAFNISMNQVTVIENSTDKVPNSVWTGASVGTDVYCRAVQTACKEILQRLEPYQSANPKGAWDQWIATAFFDRCHLAAHAHCRLTYPDVQPHNPGYYVSGAAVGLVEIDCLTGDHRILRCDLVSDVGNTINPAIDVGQIEGAFMQGVGMTTMEEILYDRNGRLLTTSAFTYKIPSAATVPREFNVVLLKNENFTQNIFSSKAIGEPPFSLGYCVHFAIKNAILAFRAEHGEIGVFVEEGAPLTPEKIRLQMHDRLTKLIDQNRNDVIGV